jgi:hypothetical protein
VDGEPVVIILQRGADTWTPYSMVLPEMIDVPVELHRRIKMACASRDLEMTTWMRKLLETNVAQLENSPLK